MVLWEITLGTAYFLGLKRTYRLALKMQRKVISPKHPRIRQFLHRRTRNVFDVALKVHLKIQERDIEVGRNFGNWILRWLDKKKPEAQIRGPTAPHPETNIKMKNNSPHPNNNKGGVPKSTNRESDRHLFSACRSMLPNSPSIAATRPIGHNIHYRQYRSGGLDFFTRNDIRQWSNMHH